VRGEGERGHPRLRKKKPTRGGKERRGDRCVGDSGEFSGFGRGRERKGGIVYRKREGGARGLVVAYILGKQGQQGVLSCRARCRGSQWGGLCRREKGGRRDRSERKEQTTAGSELRTGEGKGSSEEKGGKRKGGLLVGKLESYLEKGPNINLNEGKGGGEENLAYNFPRGSGQKRVKRKNPHFT